MKFNGYIPKNNDRRIIKRFALFPITICDKCNPRLQRRYYERRWLETVYIEQNYESYNGCWENYTFVNKEDYIKFKTENQ